MNEMKIDKCQNYCYLSNKADLFNAVLDVIPQSVIGECTAKSLGQLIDAIWKSWQKTKLIHDADIVAEGAVWDEKSQSMIELCQS